MRFRLLPTYQKKVKYDTNKKKILIKRPKKNTDFGIEPKRDKTSFFTGIFSACSLEPEVNHIS